MHTVSARPHDEAFACADLIINATESSRPYLFLVDEEFQAELYTEQLRILLPQRDVLTLPAFDCQVYDRISPSHPIVSARVDTLVKLAQPSPRPILLVISVDSFMQRVPPPDVWHPICFHVSLGDCIDRTTFIQNLTRLGFKHCDNVREVGDFALRGGIIDCFPARVAHPVRLDFLGDELENIRFFDVHTQQSIKHKHQHPPATLDFSPTREVILNETTVSSFRARWRTRFPVDAKLYQAVSHQKAYRGMEHFLPLFYPSLSPLADYLPNAQIIVGHNVNTRTDGTLAKIPSFFEKLTHYYHERTHPSFAEQPYHPLNPDELYLNHNEVHTLLQDATSIPVYHDTIPPTQGVDLHDVTVLKRMGLTGLVDILKRECLKRHVVIGCKTHNAIQRVQSVLDPYDIPLTLHESPDYQTLMTPPPKKSIAITYLPIRSLYDHPHVLILPDALFMGESRASIQRPTHTPHFDGATRFFQELNTYAPGDFLAHTQHGVARYHGLETIHVDNTVHDCLVLIFADDEKLFVPVENMDLVSSYAKEDAPVELSHLGSSAWRAKREKARQKLLEVAQYLVDIAAERSLHIGPKIAYDTHQYHTFCEGFPYLETDDQARTIHDVQRDLLAPQPMDRLVCGDVGFGKTEVALRAAFMVATSGHQVVVVVPTTLLARQHYTQWRERFKNFGISVEMLCRLVKPKDATAIKNRVASGETSILIATHAAFSKHVTFKNLGLLIIDEEHHFGVKQKEELKKLRAHLHVLTLTATPIPRTLQMSFTNIRSLSLMTTPPKDRLPVRTFVLEEDWSLIREVIVREHSRGGQIFYVTPRTQDLPDLEAALRTHLPNLRIATAHGQMPARMLEDVMIGFDRHDFDILLATNIIESGIDVPNANTMIVHKAHLFGLAQLYQMRGRVGRSHRQGYAYFTLPCALNMRDQAEKRLNVLKSLDKLGSGFQLASHDLDLRGAGNLVGEEQSGHVRDMGAELYQHMLKEAIASVKADRMVHDDTPERDDIGADLDFSPQLNLGMSVMIPDDYVADLAVRLSLYKRASRLLSPQEVDDFSAELKDRFGPYPPMVGVFLDVLRTKNICRRAGITKVDVGPKGMTFWIHEHHAPDPLKLMHYVKKNENILKLRPDGSLILSGVWRDTHKRLSIIQKLCQALIRMRPTPPLRAP